MSYRYALIATVGSVLGAALGYVIGWGLWDVMAVYFYAYVPGVTEEGFARVGQLFSQYDFWLFLLPASPRILAKIFTIAVGVFAILISRFLCWHSIGRGLRFYLVANSVSLYDNRLGS